MKVSRMEVFLMRANTTSILKISSQMAPWSVSIRTNLITLIMLGHRRSRVPTTSLVNKQSCRKSSPTTQRHRLGLLHTKKNLIWRPTRTTRVKNSQPHRFLTPIIASIRNTRLKKPMSDAFTLTNQWKPKSSRQRFKTRDLTLSNRVLCSILQTLDQRTIKIRKLKSSPQLMRHLTNLNRQGLKTKHLSRRLP